MQRILISCPSSGRSVPTMHRMRAAAFDAISGRFSFRCGVCGEVHHWRKEDAWLERPAFVAPDVAA